MTILGSLVAVAMAAAVLPVAVALAILYYIVALPIFVIYQLVTGRSLTDDIDRWDRERRARPPTT
jgi:hypothetical protein